MCGRFALRVDIHRLTEHFALKQSVVLKPRYNIAPGQLVPVIRNWGELEFLYWGLRPNWLKPDANGFINARMETLSQKPSFKKAFKKQRCLIISDGFFEWKHIAKIKQPYFIKYPQDQVFAFAGLYENDTCAIVTKGETHRVPVILNPHDYQEWLDCKSTEETLYNCMQFEAMNDLQVFPVSTKMNNPKHDSEILIL